MDRLIRIIRHLGYPRWWLRRALDRAALDRIGRAVATSESGHGAEIRVAIETRLGLWALLAGQTPRQRAGELFAQLRVWDTEANNGVLIYMLLADRQFEIVADRAVGRAVPQAEWQALCREMEALLAGGRYEAALELGVERIGSRIAALFPRTADDRNELLDRPVVL